MTLAPELVDRFRADLAAVGFPLGSHDAWLGIALSGGGDSLALLLLAQAAVPGRVQAATVDHQLRPESAEEARKSAEFCRQLNVPHHTLRVTVAPGNLQAQARTARYDALAQWCNGEGLTALATAHHQDDQAETLMMRLNRGSGVSGLAAIRPRGKMPGSDVPVIRPLLSWNRAELRQIVDQKGWQPVDDPSNANAAFDRVRMRAALENAEWINPAGLARSASLLAGADAAIAAVAERDFAQGVTIGDGEITFQPQLVPTVHPLITGVVIQMICEHLEMHVDQGEASRIAAALHRGDKINIAGIEARAKRRDGETIWLFRRENPRRTAP